MGKRRSPNNRYKKNPAVPKAVSQFFAKSGQIGGAIGAHRRWGTPLPEGIVDPKDAETKNTNHEHGQSQKTGTTGKGKS